MSQAAFLTSKTDSIIQHKAMGQCIVVQTFQSQIVSVCLLKEQLLHPAGLGREYAHFSAAPDAAQTLSKRARALALSQETPDGVDLNNSSFCSALTLETLLESSNTCSTWTAACGTAARSSEQEGCRYADIRQFRNIIYDVYLGIASMVDVRMSGGSPDHEIEFLKVRQPFPCILGSDQWLQNLRKARVSMVTSVTKCVQHGPETCQLPAVYCRGKMTPF